MKSKAFSDSTIYGNVDYYIADISLMQDYYAFGFKLTGREISAYKKCRIATNPVITCRDLRNYN